MTTLSIAILLLILLYGLIFVFAQFKKARIERNFIVKYYNIFSEFVSKYNTKNFDSESYVWLTKNVNKVQILLGVNGILDYTAPYQFYRIPKYEVIVNTLPKFRSGTVESEDIGLVQDCLLRYSGVIESREEKYWIKLKNPVIWFQVGMQQILAIPITTLSYFGIYSIRTANKIKESLIWRMFSGIFSLITFMNAIIGIIVGWDRMIEFWLNLFRRLM